jgi:hypothetical protein
MKAIKRSICAIVVAVVVGLATAASAQGQAVQRVAPVDATQTVVFETPGLLRVTTGSACGESNRSGTEPTIELEGEAELPSFATEASVLLSGWRLKYLKGDHRVALIEARLPDIRRDESTLRWTVQGQLRDRNGDDGYRFCYNYIVLAWNQVGTHPIDALPTHNHAPANCQIFGGSDPSGCGADRTMTTALSVLPSFLRDPRFTKGVTAIPRGFSLKWGTGSAFSSTYRDRDILQFAYVLGQSERFFERGKRYGGLGPPSNPPPPSQVVSDFISWDSMAILKENQFRRNTVFTEWFSALAGKSVAIIEPSFSIHPSEDLGGWFSGCISEASGVKTEEVRIENVPFVHAVPVLAGWDLAYGCRDQHVSEIGIWLHDIHYDKTPGSPGTLRYKVSSVLRDRHRSPGHAMRYKVNILGLQPEGPVAPPGDSLAPIRK